MAEVKKKSCENCPSFLTARDTADQLGKSINSPTCGRFSVPLSGPRKNTKEQNEELLRVKAEKCPEYGKPHGTTSGIRAGLKILIGTSDYSDVTPPSASRSDAEYVKSCSMCKFFVRDDAVATELGWTSGICSAGAWLVPAPKQREYAASCTMKDFGPVHHEVPSWLNVSSMYDGSLQVRDPIQEFLEGIRLIDPANYETDKPVDPDDAARGILAWRKVCDPANDKSFTYLPIFDKKMFSADDQALIPKTGDPEGPHLYDDHFGGVFAAAVAWAELNETPALWGEPGTGKTELFRHLAWLMQLPFRRLSITASTEIDDIAGKMHYSPDKGTYFQYGRLPYAWGLPGIICVDEPNVGQPDVWQFLRPLTDNSKQLVLDQNNGEVITRHSSAYLGMAMNPAWDPRNVGALEIGDADVNRLFHISVPLPPAETELMIIKNRVALDGWMLTPAQEKLLMNVARDIRGLIDNGTLTISWAIRPQIKVARALRWFKPLDAYRRAVADFLEPQVASALLEVVRSNA